MIQSHSRDAMKNSSSTISMPNPTPFLFLMAGIVAWALLSDGSGPLGVAGICFVLLVMVTAIVYFLANHPLFTVVTLVAAGAMARIQPELSGLKVRPEYIAAIFFCLALPFWSRAEWPRPKWMLPDLFLALYMFANMLSSLVMSVDPPKTLRWAFQQCLVILPYFLLRTFCADFQRFRKIFNILLIVGAVQAAIGTVCFFSYTLFGTEFGMEIGQYGSIPGTYGIELEANILGAVSAAALIMMVTVYFKERRRIYLWGIACTFSGLLISLSRAAIMAAGFAFVLVLLVSVKSRLFTKAAFKKVIVVLLITSVIVLPFVLSLFMERFSTLDVSDVTTDSDTAFRVVEAVSAVDGIIAHPIMGNGTASFQLLVSYQDMGLGQDESGTWIGNTELRVLHDTGLLGFGLFLSVVGILVWRAWKILRKQLIPELWGLLIATLLYAITFQATEGTLMEFYWVHMGLMGCVISIYWNSETKQASQNGHNSFGSARA
jgi:O-antigen ligase